jgi:hypothetical protein
MKLIDTFSENDIIEILCSPELDAIEYKGTREIVDINSGEADIKKENLAKAISALLNFGGGKLLLGINEKNKSIDDGGIPVNLKNGTKAWLENVLPTLVDPPIQSFNIFEIRGESKYSEIHEEKAVYLIDLKESTLAPHQSAIEHVYYGRSGAKSIKLGNQMVMDVANRKKYPSMVSNFYIAFVDEPNINFPLKMGNHPVLYIEITNNGPVFAQYVNILIYFPRYLIPENAIDNYLHGQTLESSNMGEVVRIVRENVVLENYDLSGEIISKGSGRYCPILPMRTHNFMIPLVDDFHIHRQFFRNNPVKFYCEIYADNAPKIIETHLLKDIKNIPASFFQFTGI